MIDPSSQNAVQKDNNNQSAHANIIAIVNTTFLDMILKKDYKNNYGSIMIFQSSRPQCGILIFVETCSLSKKCRKEQPVLFAPCANYHMMTVAMHSA